ncbi:MAG: c-type cytochrome [Aquincola sp.]|nr:c-type cytochrome [Aquincola sp.]MDH4287702.1 c-type cytochrome [Aquincola sp.]MDH5329071.1 c-type cytochrome [Aquincola sp.]
MTAAHAGDADTEAAMTKAGCMACHTKDKKLVGPAFKDIAAKYKGQADVVTKLAEKVRKGGSGVFGPVPMAPNGADKISDKDLKDAVELILKS